MGLGSCRDAPGFKPSPRQIVDGLLVLLLVLLL